jgi:hypothetical protein
VARDVRYLTDQCWRIAAVAAERVPAGRRAGWERLDGQPLAADGTVVLGSDGVARVRVRAARNRAAEPRLLRLPSDQVLDANGASVPVTLAQHPQAGDPAPCATPTVWAGQPLLLPVPAGRAISDLVVELRGPPGTRFTAPELVSLAAAGGRPQRMR